MLFRSHNEELHSLYRSPNIVRVIKSRRLRNAGYVARMEEGRSTFRILTSKSTRTRPLGRPMRRWEVNIRMDLKEIGINARNLVDSTFECEIESPAPISHEVSHHLISFLSDPHISYKKGY